MTDLRQVAGDAKGSFPSGAPPAPVQQCRPEAPPPAKPPPPPDPKPCSAETMLANIAKCDGASDIWAKATKANGGKPPWVKVEGAAGGFGGHTDYDGGGIVISPNPDCCGATQTLMFELNNFSSQEPFKAVDKKAADGDCAREPYARENERIEYGSGLASVKAFNSCKDAWGCGKDTKARHGFVADAKDFDDYYDHYLRNDHKDYYRKFWDDSYKEAYEKKHPPAPPPKGGGH